MYFFPKVVQTIPGDDFTVYAYFIDGTVRLVDIKPLIEKSGVFAPLGDVDFFKSRLTVLNDTVAWDMTGDRDETACIDLDPIEIYKSAVVEDPLRNMV